MRPFLLYAAALWLLLRAKRWHRLLSTLFPFWFSVEGVRKNKIPSYLKGASARAALTDGRACRSRFKNWKQQKVICVPTLERYVEAVGSYIQSDDEVALAIAYTWPRSIACVA